MTQRHFVCFCFSIFFMWCSPASAQKLTLGILDFPPFYIVEKEKIGGEFLQVMEKIATRAGFEYQVQGYPSRRLFKLLSEGEVNFYVGIKGIETYDKDVLYSDMPVSEIRMTVFSTKTLDDINNIHSLKNKSVIVIAGFTYGGFRKDFLEKPENNVTLLEAIDHEAGLRMLNAHRADLMLHYWSPINAYLESYRVPGLEMKAIQILDCYIIVPKKTPQAEAVMEALTKAYLTLYNEGQMPKKTSTRLP